MTSVAVWCAVLLVPCFQLSTPTIVELGGPAVSTSVKQLTPTSSVLYAILRLDARLVGGTLRAFRFTTADRSTPLRLQLWRPLQAGRFMLVHETRFVTTGANSYQVEPGMSVVVRDNDVIGFLSELPSTGIVYDYDHAAQGAETVFIEFSKNNQSTLTKVGQIYRSKELIVRVYNFSISVLVDTAYESRPLANDTTKVGQETHMPTPLIRAGNPIRNGLVLDKVIGSFILQSDDVIAGNVINFRFYASTINTPVIMQVWRPVTSSNNSFFTIVGQVYHLTNHTGPTIVAMPQPLPALPGDRLGFAVLRSFSALTHTPLPCGPVYHVVGVTWAVPDRLYNVTWSSNNTCFSLAADIDPHVNATQASGHGGSVVNLVLTVVTGLVYVLIVTLLTLYGVWLVHTRRRPSEVKTGSPPVPLTPYAPQCRPLQRLHISLRQVLVDAGDVITLRGRVLTEGDWTTTAVRMPKESASDQNKRIFLQQIDAMSCLQPHINVLQLLGSCTESEPLLMVTPPVPFGGLLQYLRGQGMTCTDLDLAGHYNFTVTMELLSFGAQVARGMAYLSSQTILTYDLAARNVLLGDEKVCKISSFGFERDVIESRKHAMKTQSALPVRWMAPESVNDDVYSASSDVWAFGVLLWEVLTFGATPHCQLDYIKARKKVEKGQPPEMPMHCTKEVQEVLQYCWKPKPRDRPSFDQLATQLQALCDQKRDLVQLEWWASNRCWTRSRTDELEIL